MADGSDIAGQVAIVTGATRGLGRELALSLARAGVDIVILGRGTADGEVAAASIRALGRRALFIPTDVTEPGRGGRVRAARHRGIRSYRYPGLQRGRRPAAAARSGKPTRRIFTPVFDVNVLGVMLAMRAVLPAMIARRSGRIVVIGGSYGHKGVANFAVYAASKWALRGLVKSVALEVGGHGVTANLIAPGGVEGARLRGQFQKSADAKGEPVEAVLERFLSGSVRCIGW